MKNDMDEGIVLKITPYLETSVIINLITENGFITLISKGAKRRKSEKLSLTEPLNRISFIKSERGKMPSLIEGNIIDSYDKIKEDIYKYSISSIMLEYIYQIREIPEGGHFYQLLIDSLNNVKDKKDSIISLFHFFIVYSKLLGLSINKERLKEEHLTNDIVIDDLEKVMRGEMPKDIDAVFNLFIDYFDKEMGLRPKSIKLYKKLTKNEG